MVKKMEYYSEIKTEIKEIRSEIKDLRHELTKYKGFVGGVFWTVTALSAAAHFALNWLLKH